MLVIVPLAAQLLRTLVQDGFFIHLGAVVAQVAAFLIGAQKILENGLRQVNTRVTNFDKAKSSVDKLLARKRQEPSDAEKTLQNDIVALKAKEEQSEVRLSAAAARVVELEERIKAVQQGRSLAHFLTERTRSDDYRKYLGLVSTIRQDFDALSRRLGNPLEDKLNRVDRIILYIDDLDRCPEDKVIEVLQAVHLLLAYPLFVVVVAVDPRWLLYSLRQTYGAFQRNGKERDADGEAWRTTPQNYLEKIFQIPFNLRPMTSDGYERLVGTLMSANGEGDATEQAENNGRTQMETSLGVKIDSTEQPREKSGTGSSDKGTSGEDQGKEVQKPTKQVFQIHEEALTIREWERKFAGRLFQIIPTPRAVKRFSNVYRILKAPVPSSRLQLFEGTGELLGEFQVPMFLLAILIGSPAEAVAIFPELQKRTRANGGVSAVLHDLGVLTKGSDDNLRTLQAKIRPIIDDPQFPHDPELFEYWIPRVARFSFDVGRAIEYRDGLPNRGGDGQA